MKQKFFPEFHAKFEIFIPTVKIKIFLNYTRAIFEIIELWNINEIHITIKIPTSLKKNPPASCNQDLYCRNE